MGERRLALPVVDELPVERLPVESLRRGDSPRLSGESSDHIQALAQTDATLPPILVHRRTMRVIDGIHRLRAAQLRGDREIAARLFDGDDDDAFVLAVQANIAHGLPLTLADRVAAATRILNASPHRSDRVIAATTGLAATTVAGIRGRSTARSGQSNTRIGLDGRLRPMNTAEARRRVCALMAANPDASLRAIARQAGVSPATALDVRQRLNRGDDPVPPKQREAPQKHRDARRSGSRRGEPKGGTAAIPSAILQNLRRDPSLRFNDAGRGLLLWLSAHSRDLERWPQLVEAVPPHCLSSLIEFARQCAGSWNAFARALDDRGRP